MYDLGYILYVWCGKLQNDILEWYKNHTPPQLVLIFLNKNTGPELQNLSNVVKMSDFLIFSFFTH